MSPIGDFGCGSQVSIAGGTYVVVVAQLDSTKATKSATRYRVIAMPHRHFMAMDERIKAISPLLPSGEFERLPETVVVAFISQALQWAARLALGGVILGPRRPRVEPATPGIQPLRLALGRRLDR